MYHHFYYINTLTHTHGSVKIQYLIKHCVSTDLLDSVCSWWESVAGWFMHCTVNPQARVQLMGTTGWRTIFQFLSINTCADPLVLVSPSHAQHTLKCLMTIVTLMYMPLYPVRNYELMALYIVNNNTMITSSKKDKYCLCTQCSNIPQPQPPTTL